MRALLLLAAAVALGGCVDPTGSYPERRFYTVEAVREGAPREPARGSVLKVRPFRVSRAYEGRELVYRLDEQSYESDFYNAFFVDPASMLTQAVRGWLADARQFEHVVPTDSYLQATHVLEGNLTALYGDFRDRERPAACLEIQIVLLDDTEQPPRIVLHRTYRELVELEDESPAALVTGFGTSLSRALTALEEDIVAAGLSAE
jgi:ABC-type uncharacterized transport system auxiliary subunit